MQTGLGGVGVNEQEYLVPGFTGLSVWASVCWSLSKHGLLTSSGLSKSDSLSRFRTKRGCLRFPPVASKVKLALY